MALTFTHRDTEVNTTNTNPYVFANSFTIQANSVGLLGVMSHRTGGAASPTSISGPGSASWVEITHVDFNTIATPLRRLTLYRCCPSADQTGAVTVNFAASQSNCFMACVQVDGSAGTSANSGSDASQQNATNRNDSATASPFTVTLAAFSNGNNGTFGLFGSYAQTQNYTQGSGFTAGTNGNGTGTASDSGDIFTEWKTTNDTTVDVTYTTAQGNAGIAIEVIAAAAASPNPSHLA